MQLIDRSLDAKPAYLKHIYLEIFISYRSQKDIFLRTYYVCIILYFTTKNYYMHMDFWIFSPILLQVDQ